MLTGGEDSSFVTVLFGGGMDSSLGRYSMFEKVFSSFSLDEGRFSESIVFWRAKGGFSGVKL